MKKDKTKSDLSEFEDNWETEMGAAFLGERVIIRGKDLFKEFSNKRWQSLLLFIVTGKMFKQNEIEMLEQIWTLSSNYTDPRIWNNRVAALAGTVKSTAHLGAGAACAVTEAKVYGGQPILEAADFIIRAKKNVDEGGLLEKYVVKELTNNRVVAGFGRPMSGVDERIKPLEQIMKRLQFDKGVHVQLAYEVEKILLSGRWRLRMNISALAAAVAADIGLTAKQFYLWLVNGFSAGMIGCYLDASSKPEGSLFPLRCERVSYKGKGVRHWE